MIDTFAAHVLRKLINGQDKAASGYKDKLTDPESTWAAAILAEPPGPERTKVFTAAIAGLAEQSEIESAVWAADPQADLSKIPLPAATPASPEYDDGFDMPELPAAAQLDPGLAAGACPWLDTYINFSKYWSPRAFDGFHEAVGLWVLSTVAARRVMVHMGKPRFSNLYFALTARTSIHAKSTTAEIGIQIINKAGLSWLLAADSATPQKFMSDLTPKIAEGYDSLTPEQKDYIARRVGMAGQRGWFYDEFGQHIAAMLREGGVMADFRGLLRRFDDTPERYEIATISRGNEIIERPYLGLIASLTPDDLRPFARKGSTLWGDGFLARFALITPPEGGRLRGRFPTGQRNIPGNLLTPLVDWHNRLGVPAVDIVDIIGKDNKPTGFKRAEVTPHLTDILQLPPEVNEAFNTYHDSLGDLIDKSENHDLDGNYSRFAEKALRVSLLLASVNGQHEITLPCWARAQAITESWRAGLHRLYDQINDPGPSAQKQLEEKLMAIIAKHGLSNGLTAADAARFIRGLASADSSRALDSLVAAGELTSDTTNKKTKRYKIV